MAVFNCETPFEIILLKTASMRYHKQYNSTLGVQTSSYKIHE